MKKPLMIATLPLLLAVFACQAPVANVVGPSSTGNTIAINAFAGNGGLPADGISQATIRVEVYNALTNAPTDGATVMLTTTLGTLGKTSLTTAAGVAVTTLTSTKTAGLAYIVATVDNVSATTSIAITTH